MVRDSTPRLLVLAVLVGTAFSPGGAAAGADDLPLARPAPAWVHDLPVGSWQAISRNKVVDVTSARAFGYRNNNAPWSSTEGISGIVDDWNGAAMAHGYGAAGALLLFGGGHGGYGGSDVYGFDLASRQWRRLSNPYPDISVASETGTFPDGSPIPPHTYDLVEYHPPSNSFVALTAYKRVSGTFNLNVAHMLNLDHLTAENYTPDMWRRSYVNPTRTHVEGSMSCYDRNRASIWVWEVPRVHQAADGWGNNFARFDPLEENGRNDGTIGRYHNYPGDGGGFGSSYTAACDPHNDLFVFLSLRYGKGPVWYRDLRTPERPARRIEQITGDGPANVRQAGWEYAESRRAFVFWNGGHEVWALRIEPDDTRAFRHAAWRLISKPGLAPEVNPNGTYSKFRIAAFEADGELIEVALVVSAVGENVRASPMGERNDGHVYALRIPPGER